MALRSIFLTIVGILVACAGAGVFADRWARAHAPAEDAARSHDGTHDGDERAESLARAGNLDGAEKRYWEVLQEGPPTVPLVVSFLRAHQNAVEADAPDEDGAASAAAPREGSPSEAARQGSPSEAPRQGSPIDEAAIDAFLVRPDLPPGVALLGRYWRGIVRGMPDAAIEKEVLAAAAGDPPVPYANDLLARDELSRGQLDEGELDEAAEHFLREGTFFRERSVDVSIALEHWMHKEAWERIDQALSDRRVAALAPPWLQLRSAVSLRDWRAAARAYPRCLPPPVSFGSLALAFIAALVWGTFCARLGGISARPRVRLPLYLTAFGLGVVSVSLTLVFVVFEEVFLKMNETGDPLRDLLFFTFGVGLREEVSKLVFFAPLLPLIRSARVKGTRLDVLICGALVGLGFAAEENLGYLHEGDLSTAMARFLTANFFHMSMTAILAGALDRATSPPPARYGGASPRFGDRVRFARGEAEDGSLQFSRALLTVAAMHGIYDFCLSERAYGNISYFSMGVFLLLTREFLALVSAARAKERFPRPRLLETFSLGMAIVVGASFIYASALVGPGPAAAALAEGLLGLSIIIFIFVQELRRV